MTRALLMSSFVASSRVGGGAQSLALALSGIDPVLAPTVLFGRHPGLGAPGGGAVAPELFAGVLAGIAAKGDHDHFGLIMTGYFSHPDQVIAAAAAIDAVRAARLQAGAPLPLVLVDPVMGDAGKGLYVKPEVAHALADHLVPRADILAPNAWELERLSGLPVTDGPSALLAARALGRTVLVSSVPCDAGVGVVLALKDQAWMVSHALLPDAPNGVGDLLGALMASACLAGLAPHHALTQAVGGVFEAILASHPSGGTDLPLVAMGKRLNQGSDHVSLSLLD